MTQREVRADCLNRTFAGTMEIVTWIGIIVMVVSGVLYFAGVSAYVDESTAVRFWNEPVGEFWRHVEGTRVSGYGWFLSHYDRMDCISMLGICTLALAPLCSLISALRKSGNDKAYALFSAILIFEFLFAIVRPLVMGGPGG